MAYAGARRSHPFSPESVFEVLDGDAHATTVQDMPRTLAVVGTHSIHKTTAVGHFAATAEAAGLPFEVVPEVPGRPQDRAAHRIEPDGTGILDTHINVRLLPYSSTISRITCVQHQAAMSSRSAALSRAGPRPPTGSCSCGLTSRRSLMACAAPSSLSGPTSTAISPVCSRRSCRPGASGNCRRPQSRLIMTGRPSSRICAERRRLTAGARKRTL